MDENVREFYGEFLERMERELIEMAERLTDRINHDPSVKSIFLFFGVSVVLLAFLLLFIGLFLAIGFILAVAYLCIRMFSFFKNRGDRD